MTITGSYIIATLLSSIILAVGEFAFPDRGLAILFAISPSLLALAFSAFDRDRPLRALGWRPNFPYWLVILGITAGMTTALLLVAWGMGHTEVNEKALKKFFQLATLVGLLVGIAVNTGEETGWRGYLFPKLYNDKGWWPAIFISALVWWAWHVPFMAVLQIRQFGEVQWGTQAIHLASIIPVTVLSSIWFLKSGSFWAIGFGHQLANFVNKWFLGLEHSAKHPIFFRDKSWTHLYSLENGVLGFAVLLIVATILCYRNRELINARPSLRESDFRGRPRRG